MLAEAHNNHPLFRKEPLLFDYHDFNESKKSKTVSRKVR